MPHRGRLNVLANIVGKPYSKIFTEFEGNMNPAAAHGSGDVKYHLGAEGTYLQMFGDDDIKVSLTANPSHLEAVDPVLEGLVRAKQDLLDKGEDRRLLGHAADAARRRRVRRPGCGRGDAEPFAVCAATASAAPIHIVVNNQVGFTTAPEYSRSTEYCTDVAKMIGAPIFHVNGDDPEACVWVAQLAVDFRQKFHKDVVIDMICYRRRGHNEGDDPSMTQPHMYDVIDTKRSVRKSYTESPDRPRRHLAEGSRRRAARLPGPAGAGVQRGSRAGEVSRRSRASRSRSTRLLPHALSTAVDKSVLQRIGDAFLNVPEGFTVHPRVKPVLEKRREMAHEGKIDWAFAELLAFGTLVDAGHAGPPDRPGFPARHVHASGTR